MSAWDIAGAVVWSPLALAQWGTLLSLKDPSPGLVKKGFFFTITTTLGAVFCIARLCGAHA